MRLFQKSWPACWKHTGWGLMGQARCYLKDASTSGTSQRGPGCWPCGELEPRSGRSPGRDQELGFVFHARSFCGIHVWRVPRPDLCWGSGWRPLIRISSYRDGTTQEAQKGFSVFQGRLSSLDELCELCDSCWHSRVPQPGERASDAAPPATGPAAPAPSQESIHATPPKSKSTILCQPLLSL